MAAVDLLVAGGASDPHNSRIAEAAHEIGASVVSALHGPDAEPQLAYDLHNPILYLDGAPVTPRALWLRHDVFAALRSPRRAVVERAHAWYAAMDGWAALRPDVRRPNRLAGRVDKVAQLAAAAAAGLRVPRTRVTNLLDAWHPGDVAKPVAGGSTCQSLDALRGVHGSVGAQPAFVQERLAGPEVRAYLIGGQTFAWEIHTDALDHRDDPGARLSRFTLPSHVDAPLHALARGLGLDLSAADLKRDRTTGALVFLEINTQPMWTAYDAACDGALARAMLTWLVG